MTNEEKKAIESLIEIREFANLSSYKDVRINQLNAIDIILNLIEKQSKEIEELKNGQIDFWISDKEIAERIRNKFVSKDKIKEFIKEELPDDEICECCDIIDVNGVEIKQKLKSLIEKE